MEIVIAIIGTIVSIISLFNRTDKLLKQIRDVLIEIRDFK